MSTAASREAYQGQLRQMPAKRAAVWDVVRSCPGGGVTIREACVLTRWPYNTVSARIHELAECGLIKESGQVREGQTAWVPAEEGERESLRAAREKAREDRDAKKEGSRLRAIKTGRYVYLPAAVRGDGLFAATVAPPGLYRAHVNPQGAVSVLAENGNELGVKPGEFVELTVRSWE